jgi:heme exporter protein D
MTRATHPHGVGRNREGIMTRQTGLQWLAAALSCCATLALAQDAEMERIKALDEKCRVAREAKIQEARRQKIAECIKTEPQKGRAECERYWADWGWGAALAGGGRLPSLYEEIPECVAAFEAWEKRRR